MMKQSQSTPTPHDATFRQYLSDPDVARDFIALHLPARLQEMCDLSTLRLEQGSFVDEDLRSCFSDVLYSLKTIAGDSYIQVLIEHQSTPDKHMAFRLMRYAVAAMQRHLDAGNKYLPLVIPILFYAGKRKGYPHSTKWLDEFRHPDVAEQLYNCAFPLVDVTVIPDDEIMHHRRMAALTLILKHAQQRDLLTLIDRLTTVIQSSLLSREQFRLLISYMIKMGKSTDAQAVLAELKRRMPQRGDEMMTLAEQFELTGYQKGIANGVEKGIEKGIKEGQHLAQLGIARTMLQMGLDEGTILQATGLAQDALDGLVEQHAG